MSPRTASHATEQNPDGPESSDIRGFFRDGAALGASATFTALIGMVGWLVAARMLPPAQVGHATSFVNGFMLVAAVSELGFGQATLRWLPVAGSAAPRIVRRVYVAVLGTCLVGSVLWASFAPVSLHSGWGPTAERGLFVVGCLFWMLFHVQVYVLTGVGAARWVPVENIAFGLLRLALLVGLAHWLGALGIVLAWVISVGLGVLAVSAGLVAGGRRAAGPAVYPDRHDVLRDAGGTWFANLATTLLNNLVPVLVVARYGPATGAVFSIVWLGLNALDVASIGFGSALVVRLRGASVTMLRDALRRVLPMFAAPLLLAGLLAAPLLSLFGPTYAERGDGLLRLAVAGALFRAVVVMVASIHLARGRAPRMAALHWTTTAVLIALVVLAPVRGGLVLLGVGYLVAQVVLAAGAVLDLVRCGRREDLRSAPEDGQRRTPLGASRP